MKNIINDINIKLEILNTKQFDDCSQDVYNERQELIDFLENIRDKLILQKIQ